MAQAPAHLDLKAVQLEGAWDRVRLPGGARPCEEGACLPLRELLRTPPRQLLRTWCTFQQWHHII